MGRYRLFPDAEPSPDGQGQFPRISAGWEPEGSGYVVQCWEDVESLSFLLSTSSELSEPQVYIELGGLTQELWPRQLFVPYADALKAIQHLLSTGKQDSTLAWVGLCTFKRKTVAPRSRPPPPPKG